MAGTALITGGAKRIGRTIALALAEEGFDIALHYGRSEEAAREAANAIEDQGRSCRLFQCNLVDFDAVRRLVPQVVEACPDLSLLVNNASLFERAGLADTEEDLYDRQFAVNLKAPFFLSQAFARHAGAGQIINLVDQRITRSEPDHMAYTLTKKALAAFTEMAARDLAPAIRVNGVCPGLILPPPGKTARHLSPLVEKVPLKRRGDPADIAAAVVYLVKQEYVTGQFLFVDGGEHIP